MALILTGIFTGCSSESSCPKGSTRHGDRCIESDSGTNQDASDSAMDGEAGPCGVCPTDKPLCDETSNTCVTCLENTDCTTASAPHCDVTTGNCSGCTEDSECTTFTDTPVCNETANTCVACVPGEDVSLCTGTEACDSATFACKTDTCRQCSEDSECISDHRCISMNFGATMRPNGYCLLVATTPSSCPRPYTVILEDRLSLSGALAADYCGINETGVAATTCEAVLDLLIDKGCSTNDECGATGLADGVCTTVGVLPNKCTYECLVSDECDSDTSCSVNGYCQ